MNAKIPAAFAGSIQQEQFDEAFDYVAASRDPFVLQIGANDGLSCDPLHASLKRHGSAALLVEPQPEFAAFLKSTYAKMPKVAIECCAIAEYDGTARLYRVPPALVFQQMWPRWMGGIASLYTDRNAIGGVRVDPDAAAMILAQRTAIDVPCCTLPSLLAKHAITAIDILVIDTEGADWMVLRQLDLDRFRPALIYFEILNLQESETQEALSRLGHYGYRIYATTDHANVLATIGGAAV